MSSWTEQQAPLETSSAKGKEQGAVDWTQGPTVLLTPRAQVPTALPSLANVNHMIRPEVGPNMSTPTQASYMVSTVCVVTFRKCGGTEIEITTFL